MHNGYTNECPDPGGGNRLKKINKNSWIFVLEITLMVFICIMHSINAGHYANYYPINGTFQNFNPVRRLLAGQIPYRDFQDYLGLGHLYTGSIFTGLYGGDYQGSLQAFSFLTFGGLALLSLMISIAVIKRKKIAGAVTNIILIVFLVEPLFYKNALAGTNEILIALEYALGTGNSARFIRGMILPISCFLLFLGYLAYERWIAKTLIKWKKHIPYAGIGAVAGFSFSWSNDYGISCWLCLLIMVFWLSVCRERKFLSAIRAFLIALVLSVAVLFITIEVFTLGHFEKWFSDTFGTGGYQFWYYNSSKSYYLYDVDFTYMMLIQAGLAIVYLIMLFIAKGTKTACRRYGILAFANMVCFCAVNEYQFLSGGGAREVALSTLFLNVFIELGMLISTAGDTRKNTKAVLVASFVVGLAWVISTVKDEAVFYFMTAKDGIAVEELGGNLTSLGEDLKATEEFLDGNEFFATYASAQEVLNNTFQPSGTDYIIHVLGDSQREAYLNAFRTGSFKYAATIRETYTDWEYWVQRANWFFYRELYENWHPVYANSYELYWERNEKENQNKITDGYSVEIVDVDQATKKLIVQCEGNTNGIADIFVDYSANKKGNKSAAITIQTVIKVENTGIVYALGGSYYESNYLRSKYAEYIPVPVVNGYGEVTLTSNPTRNTYLILNEVFCNCIYTVPTDYLTVKSLETHDDNTTIFVDMNQYNQNRISGITAVLYQDKIYNIVDVQLDALYIHITVAGKMQLNQRNQVKIIR